MTISKSPGRLNTNTQAGIMEACGIHQEHIPKMNECRRTLIKSQAIQAIQEIQEIQENQEREKKEHDYNVRTDHYA